jgi:uncharacterized protein YvpB
MKLKQPVLFLIAAGLLVLVVMVLIFLQPLRLSPATASNDSWTTQVAEGVNGTMQAEIKPTNTTAPNATVFPPTSTPLPPTATPFIVPEEHYIQGFKGHSQYYSLGCEASAAVDLAEYFDIHFYQFDFQFDLPVSDNPDLGFVGDVNGPWGQIPPYAYGVHAAPVADLLNDYGLPVEGGKGYTLDQIKETLAQNKPVIVWVIGRMEYSQPVEYTDKAGNKTVVARYEHVVILTGYNENTVRFVSNGYWYDIENETFLNFWGVLGNMAVLPK